VLGPTFSTPLHCPFLQLRTGPVINYSSSSSLFLAIPRLRDWRLCRFYEKEERACDISQIILMEIYHGVPSTKHENYDCQHKFYAAYFGITALSALYPPGRVSLASRNLFSLFKVFLGAMFIPSNKILLSNLQLFPQTLISSAACVSQGPSGRDAPLHPRHPSITCKFYGLRLYFCRLLLHCQEDPCVLTPAPEAIVIVVPTSHEGKIRGPPPR